MSRTQSAFSSRGAAGRLIGVTWRLAVALALVLLVGSTPLPPISTADPARTTVAGFDARLRTMSADPLIQQAAQYRLYVGSSARSSSLTDAAASESQHPGDVHAVLAANVDDVVIVDWLVSFGAMGAWTANYPANGETVNIPVSDAASLVSPSLNQLTVYRMRDKQHLMLVRAVVVHDVAIGAIGFILAHSYQNPTLDATAIQLG